MPDPDSADILYVVQDPVAVVTLNRPEKLNAVTTSTLRSMREAMDKAQDDPAVVGIIVTGAGRGFCSGLDAQQLSNTASVGSAARGEPDPDEVPGLFTWLLQIEKPVIAAVNGVAAGGGFVLALMSDIRFASRDAWFTSVFSKRGLIAEHGMSWIVPRVVGPGRALDLLWSSRRVDADEAYRIGLVDYVVDPADLLPRARAYIEDLAANVSPASLRDTKRLVYGHLGLGYPEALREADATQWRAMDRFDAREGAAALLERRQANFPRLGREPAE